MLLTGFHHHDYVMVTYHWSNQDVGWLWTVGEPGHQQPQFVDVSLYHAINVPLFIEKGGWFFNSQYILHISLVQILAHLVGRVSRPQFCWGLAILCDPPFFSGYIEFGGVVVKFYSSVEITLYLLADFLLQYVTLFQSRDIVKNLVSL